MPLFNAVLLPSVDFRDRVVDYAQEHYAEIAQGYCLSETVYPHITLAQFEADDQPMIFIDGLFNPVFTSMNIREASDSQYKIVEWVVDKADWIIELQATVRGALESEGAVVTSPQGDDFYPHMTFCRVRKEDADDVEVPVIEQSDKPWIFTIGTSDEVGQFLG